MATYNLINTETTHEVSADKKDNYTFNLCAVLLNNNEYAGNLKDVKVNHDLTISSDQSWCMPTLSGSYTADTDAKIVCNISENTTGSDRTAKLTLNYNGSYVSNYNIKQKSKNSNL